MIDLRDGKITDLLNNSMRYNPETISVGYAILQEKQRLLEMVDKTRLMSAVDNLEERILDYLAVELRTPAYRDTFPIETKRELIKGTLPFYASLGTPAAVNWVIRALFGEGRIEEWYEYGGEPHHFRAYAGADGGKISIGNLKDFRRILDSVKRLSSWLDEIITTSAMEPVQLSVVPYMGDSYAVTVLPEIRRELPAAALRVGALTCGSIMQTVLPPLWQAGEMDETEEFL